MNEFEDLNGKLIIVGNPTVGKTTLSMSQLKLNTKDVESTKVAAAFFKYSCTIDDRTIHLEVWDTAGQEQYQSIARNYYRNVDCALILFDVTNNDSYDNLEYWFKAIKEELQDKASIILVANKIDIVSNRIVQRIQSMSKAKEMHCDYVETSAQLGINVNELFKLAAQIVLHRKYNILPIGYIPKKKLSINSWTKRKNTLNESIILSDYPKEGNPSVQTKRCY